MSYVVDIFREYAEDNDYQFTYGTDEFKNYIGDNEKVQKVIFMDPIQATGIFTENGQLSDFSYTTMISLACKSSIAENYEQKYDRYLKELSEELDTIVKTLACDYNLWFTSYLKTEFINNYDANVDGVMANITFRVYD